MRWESVFSVYTKGDYINFLMSFPFFFFTHTLLADIYYFEKIRLKENSFFYCNRDDKKSTKPKLLFTLIRAESV